GVVGRTYRHLNRYRDILGVLFRYGFGDIIETLKIEQYIEVGLQMISRKRREQIEKHSRAERVRMAVEELGPTFIKLGQILSTRPDLVPLEYAEELSKLQDHVPAFSYDEVRTIITEELGGTPEELFAGFETEPLAAASIGQVHRARLADGDEVVVKVQRPGIQEIVEVDLEILLHLASLMERHVEEMEVQRPTRIVEEFARSLEKEIDYTIEAYHTERFSRQFLGNHTIYVPKVYRGLNSSRVLTIEYVAGTKVSNIDILKREGCDLKFLAENGANLVMKQIFVHGFFHADPHPGNIFILPDNIICFLDFGMMGRIRKDEREEFTDFVTSLATRNERKIMESVLRLTHYEEEPDREVLERDLMDLMEEQIYGRQGKLEMGELFQKLIETVSTHKLGIKPDLYLMMKALGTIEGVANMLDPDFNILKQVEPFVRKIQEERMSPKRIAGDMMEVGTDLIQLGREIPGEVRAILKQAREGKLKIEFAHSGLEPLQETYSRSTNRMVFAIVLAALIIGSSLVVLAGIPPKWHDIPLVGIVGFVLAGVIGFSLIISMLRRKKM
ncbi:ABC1 family protein, partial [delta proteobacterium NaphS2]